MNKSRQSQYLIFLAGDVHFAIDVFDVIEIILPSKIDNASLKGGSLTRIKYQGEELLLLYANKLLFQSPADYPSDYRILIIEQGGQKRALAVTSAEEILHISNDCLREVSRKSPGPNFELLQGAIEQDDQMVYIIDVSSLFNMAEITKRSGSANSD